MKCILATSALALMLTGCSDSQAKARVKELLVDPASADFSDVYSKGEVTCGFVNARNRMGGFTGPRAFIVRGDAAQISSDVPDPAFVDDLKDCDSRVIERLARVMLNDKYVAAEREIRTENAKSH